MNVRVLLRIAAVLSLLYFLGHSAGMPWTPSPGGESTPVVGAMKSVHFDVSRSVRTYWDFYQGFGLMVSVFLLLESVLLWLLAGLARPEPTHVMPFLVAFLIANVAQLALVIRFFFLPPLVLSVANTLCLALAAWAARPRYAPTRS
jgi:hypothetical protein